MPRYVKTLLLLLASLVLPFAVIAQTDPAPVAPAVAEIMAAFPDTPSTRELSFANFRTLLNKPDIPQPSTAPELFSLSAPEWFLVLGQVPTKPYWLMTAQLGDDPTTFGGFDPLQPFAVSGVPPQRLELYAAIDPQAVVDAHIARGYTLETEGDAQRLCPPSGCGADSESDDANADANNVFGGSFGLQQQVIVWQNSVISSPNNTLIEDTLAAINGDAPSLLDDTRYQTVAALMDDGEGALEQFWVIPGEIVEQVNLFARTPEGASSYPQYTLLALDARATADESITRAMFIYTQEADTTRALNVIPQRLNLDEGRTMERFREAVAQGNVSATLHEDALTGLFAVIIEFRTAPLQLSPDDNTRPAPTLYTQIYEGLLLRFDATWLFPNAG